MEKYRSRKPANGKDGQVYSIIAAFLSIPVILFASVFLASVQEQSAGSIEKIVADQVGELSKSMEEDFDRAIEIGGKRAILASVNNVITHGEGLNNSVSSIMELMLNGTLKSADNYIMENNTLDDWRTKILGVTVSLQKSLSYSSLSPGLSDPFSMNFSLQLSINVSDVTGRIRFSRNGASLVNISLENFEDPLYPLKTNGYSKRLVKKYQKGYAARKLATGTPSGASCSGIMEFNASKANGSSILVIYNASGLSGFAGVLSETGDAPAVGCHIRNAANAVSIVTSTLQLANYSQLYLDNKTGSAWHLPVREAVDSGLYFGWPNRGMSFLRRLENNVTNQSTNGIESFINLPELQTLGLPAETEKSMLDHLYFSPASYPGKAVRGMQAWLRLDNASAARYNLSELMEP
ncbi:MAG: hypothetical protein HYX24_05475 [Candidatus Aenigmarchaeota archaeon]|nr:hypothetical protein [Candidatus Aenigmarchaeota archaeon]